LSISPDVVVNANRFVWPMRMPGTPAIIIPPARIALELTYISTSMFGLSKPSCGPPQRNACFDSLRAGDTTQALLPDLMKTPNLRFASLASRSMRSAARRPRVMVDGASERRKSCWARYGSRGASANAGVTTNPSRSASRRVEAAGVASAIGTGVVPPFTLLIAPSFGTVVGALGSRTQRTSSKTWRATSGSPSFAVR
jgi:hypothetical protein